MNVATNLLCAPRAKRLLARVVVCSILLVLPSCAINQLRPADSAPVLPETFNGTASTDSSALLGIDEFFSDPLLEQLIAQAFEGNRELKILDEEVQIARNEVFARKGAYLPFLTGNAGASIERPSLFTRNGAVESQLNIVPGQAFPDPLPNYGAGLNLFWQLDIWRQMRNARDAAALRYVAARERRNFFSTRLVAEVAENYYKLMALDKRVEILDLTIDIQEKSRKVAEERWMQARATGLPVQRFLADVRKNQSEKLIVAQEIVQAENRINFLLNRFPQPVERMSASFFDLKIQTLNVGVPSQLLQNRPDIRQAERELEASGLDVKVARAKFFPSLVITGGIGYEAFNPRYLFEPQALAAGVAGNLVGPVVNKTAIRAEYLSANARQLEAVYNYQRIVVNAFTEVVNRVSKTQNYTKSLEIKNQQIEALKTSVNIATDLFQAARLEYVDILLAQRDYMEARMDLIETRKEQLAAIVNAYQALGGGVPPSVSASEPVPPLAGPWARPFHGVNFWPF